MALASESRNDYADIQGIENTLAILNEKFDLRWRHQDMQFKSLDDKFKIIDQRFDQLDKKVDKVEGKLWQIIMLLLAYPLGLIVGKLCHVF